MPPSPARPFSEPERAACREALESSLYWVRPDHLSADLCAQLRDRIDGYIENCPENVSGSDGGDERIFAAEHIDDRIAAIKADETITGIAREFCGDRQAALFVMANRLSRQGKKRVRSGGQWHRDRRARQFKSLIYLSDVEATNGPFRFLPQSQIGSPLWETRYDASGFDNDALRWSDGAIAPLLEKNEEHVVHVTGKAGTMVLFDSSVIHSGSPLRSGRRYAITSYFYDRDGMTIERASGKWTDRAGPIAWPEGID